MSRYKNDQLLSWFIYSQAFLAGAILLLILIFLILESIPAFQQIGLVRFFSDLSWHPSPIESEGTFNLLPMLWGSLFAMGGAICLAAPLGIFSALFCHYYSPPFLATIFRRFIELLAGVPSVVYGLWGLEVLVPLILKIQSPGASLLAGILILAIMIFPTIALLSDAIFISIPSQQIKAATALGLTRWGILRCVVLPGAKSGLWTAILLGGARAIGETMAILMVCGNVVQIPHSLFDPIRTLTANIALEMAYAMGSHRSALFMSALFLMILILVFMLMAEFLRRKKING